MKIVDTGQHAHGFFAFGQEAVGFVAVGQVATGVIAIGQMARGVFAVGQLAFGFIGWGQAGIGVFHAAGMVGVGGRRGPGLVIPLVPSIGRPRVPPPATSIAAVQAGEPGWLAVDLDKDALGGLGLYQGSERLPIKLDRRLQEGARAILGQGRKRVSAHTQRLGDVLVCDRIVHVPPRPYERPWFKATAAAQVLALFVLGAVYWAVAGNDVVDGITTPVEHRPAAPVRKAPGRGRH
jgi:hypothetical protein